MQGLVLEFRQESGVVSDSYPRCPAAHLPCLALLHPLHPPRTCPHTGTSIAAAVGTHGHAAASDGGKGHCAGTQA